MVCVIAVSRRPMAPRPYYINIPPVKQNLPPLTVPSSDIVLTDETSAAPAKSVDDANSKFSARAAEAMRWTTNHSDFPPPQGVGIDDTTLQFWRPIQPNGDNNEMN